MKNNWNEKLEKLNNSGDGPIGIEEIKECREAYLEHDLKRSRVSINTGLAVSGYAYTGDKELAQEYKDARYKVEYIVSENRYLISI